MNFLADESLDRQIVDALRRDDHVVLYVAEMDPGISDDEVLDKAEKESAILITADKDFGELVFRQQRITNGVVLVRLAGLSSSKKAEIVSTSIKKHLDAIQNAFSVISPSAIRIRRIS
jgi:predicted nuclease of predicted toxin-antitoxin system